MAKSPFQGVDVGDPPAVARAERANLLGAIRRECFMQARWLALETPVAGMDRGYDIARRVLRVEVDRDTEGEFTRALYEACGRMFSHDEARPGPPELDGVAVYIVAYLPAPGWRVVNPFVEVKR